MSTNDKPDKKDDRKPKQPPVVNKLHARSPATKCEPKQREQLRADRMYPLQAKQGTQEIRATGTQGPRPPNLPQFNFGRSRALQREYSVEYYAVVEDRTNVDFPYMKVFEITAEQVYPPASSISRIRERSMYSDDANESGFDGINVRSLFPNWWRRHQTTYERYSASGEAFLTENIMHGARDRIPPNFSHAGGQRNVLETRSIFRRNRLPSIPAKPLRFIESNSEMDLDDSD